MNFVDGFIGTVGTFFQRKVELGVNQGMYELAVQQWGGREVTKLNTESIEYLTTLIQDKEYQRCGVELKIQQENGVQSLTIPAWAVYQLHYDLAHGNIQLPYLNC